MKITIFINGKLYIFNNEHDMLRFINKESDVVARLEGTNKIYMEDIEGGKETLKYKWEHVIIVN